MSTMFATIGSGKLVGLGAGGAVSSLVVYRRAESKLDASNADRARGRRRAAEKQRLAEKSKEAASTRIDTGDDAGGSTRKFPAPAATTPVVVAAGTVAAASEKPVTTEDRVGAKPDAVAGETVVETEVVMRSRNPDAGISSRAARHAREEAGAARASASSSSRATENGPKKRNRRDTKPSPTRTVATLAAVAAPFGLRVARNLFRHVSSRGERREASAARDDARTTKATLERRSKRVSERGAPPEPVLSLRAKAAIAAAGAGADATAELDRVIGFQAKELRFMRLALAEKDARIAELSAAAKGGGGGGRRDDDARELELSDVSRDDFADLDAAADATVDATLDATVEEMLRELAKERKEASDERDERDERSRRGSIVAFRARFAAKNEGVPFAAGGKENATSSGRFLDDSDDEFVAPKPPREPLRAMHANALQNSSRGSFVDPAARVARGKSRAHRISPTRRQRETESRLRGGAR